MHAGSLALGAPRPRLPRGRGACNNTRQFFLSGIKTSWHTKCANSSFLGPRHHGILKCANSSFLGSRHHGIRKCADSPFETPFCNYMPGRIIVLFFSEPCIMYYTYYYLLNIIPYFLLSNPAPESIKLVLYTLSFGSGFCPSE